MIVVAAAVLDAHRFGHGDLHVIDVAAIPDRLEDAVGEAKGQDVLHRLLAHVMIDAIDLTLGHELRQNAVQLRGRRQIVAKGLFHDKPRARDVVQQLGLAELPGDQLDHRRATWPGRTRAPSAL